MSAALLAELRALGLELRREGARLRVFGERTHYTASLRARVLQHARELVAELHREDEVAAEAYDRSGRAWAAEYVTLRARAEGYDEELVAVAASLVAARSPRSPFRVGRDVLTVQMREGVVVRLHRVPQSWCSRPCDGQKHEGRAGENPDATRHEVDKRATGGGSLGGEGGGSEAKASS